MNVIRQPKKIEAPKSQPPRIEIVACIVQHIPGEPLRFFVASSKPDKPDYLIDLEANSFLGQCSCEQFQFRCQEVIDGKKTGPSRCKHLVAAREFFLEIQIRWVAEQANARRVPAYLADKTVSS